MKTYIVQLEDHDDVISARDKISWSKARRVLLIWPRQGRVLERQIDLLLLQRRCQELGAQMAVVSGSGEVKSHAHELGISVFRNSAQAQRSARWRTRSGQSNGRSALWESHRPVSAEDLRERRAELPVTTPQKRWLRLVLFPLGVLAFLGLVLFFLPGAKIIISPARQKQVISLPVWAQPTIQAVNPSGGMPAHPLTVVVEGRDQSNSSGSMRTADQVAAGEVVLSNLTSQVVIIPEGAVALTTGAPPLRFRVTRGVQVPAGLGNTATAPVEAIVPGTAGNVAVGQIRALEGETGLQVVVNNANALRGGSDRTSPAPTRQDEAKLREKLLSSLENIALEELKAKIQPGQRLLENSLHLSSVVQETRDPLQDQPADVLQLTLRVEYEVWYVAESDLQAVAQAALDANLPENYTPVAGSLEYQLTLDSPQNAADPAAVVVQGKLSVAREVKAAWSAAELIPAILGNSEEAASRKLQSRLALSAAPTFELYPAWWHWLPFLPARIDLVEP
jgi:hypothetical protein